MAVWRWQRRFFGLQARHVRYFLFRRGISEKSQKLILQHCPDMPKIAPSSSPLWVQKNPTTRVHWQRTRSVEVCTSCTLTNEDGSHSQLSALTTSSFYLTWMNNNNNNNSVGNFGCTCIPGYTEHRIIHCKKKIYNDTAMKDEHKFAAFKNHKSSPRFRRTCPGSHVSFVSVFLFKSASNSPFPNR